MNAELFERISKAMAVEDNSKAFLVECSYFEVYNEIICKCFSPQAPPTFAWACLCSSLNAGGCCLVYMY